jgi:hypothetical protein
MSAPISKPCEGTVQQLTPMRMIDVIRQQAAGAPAAAASKPASASANAYVPPSKRAAGAVAEPQKQKSITEADMASDKLFPTLGAAPTAPKGVWGKPKPNAATPAPTPANQNAFAALDEDADANPSPAPSAAPLNFKAVIEERIERDREEAEEAALPETEDPAEMTEAQLIRNGWARLRKPFASQVNPLFGQAALQEFVARQDWKDELADPWEAYVNNGETWDGRLGIPKELMDTGNSFDLLVYCVGPNAAGEDPYAAKVIKEEGTLSTGKMPKALQRLMEIHKKKVERLAARAAAEAC